jgi:hypothetical protein
MGGGLVLPLTKQGGNTMAQKHWNLRSDCCVIAGYGKREEVQAFILSKIVGMRITTDPTDYNKPIRYKFLLEGGHEVEIEEPDEILAMRDILIKETEEQGGHLEYI